MLLTDCGREWVAVDRCLDAGHVYDYRARRCQDEVVQLPYEPYVVRRSALLVVAGSLALCGVALIALGCRNTPSFDSAKAGSQAEKLVCSDENLAALDRRLADRYRRLSEELPADERSRLRATQRGFIKGRDDCWTSDDLSACVRDGYHERLIDLQLQDPRLFGPTPAGYDCPEKDPRKPLTVTYYAHFDPPAAVVTYGDAQVRMVLTGEHAGQHARDYGARGSSLRQQGLGMTLDWYGRTMYCTARGSPRTRSCRARALM